MLKNKALVFSLIFSILLLNVLISHAQQKSSSSEPLTIKANYKEKTNEIIFATGDVEIVYKDIKLFADRAEINTDTKDIYAAGNVVIQMSDEQVSAEEVRINLDSSEGELKKGFGLIQPSTRYEAETVKRDNASVYSFRKARFTSCTQPVPRWNFSCSKAKFKKGDYIAMSNAVFTIKKIPVFYLPYMRYPLDEERSTGFLVPQLGYSGLKGFSFTQSFYLIIKRNMDATFNLDYYSAKGIGGGLEYRYRFAGGTRGNLNLYRFMFKDEEEEGPSGAYLFRFDHKQVLPLDFSLVADIDYSSSFNFLREFDNNFKRAVISNRNSQLYLSRSWSYFNFNARASRFETYFRQNDFSVIRYSLPQISFRSSKIKLFSPLYFSFASSYHRWEYGRDSAYEEGTQLRSQSLDFSPQLSFPFSGIPWLTLNTTLFTNLTYHFQSYAPDTKDIIQEPLFISTFGFDAELVGPVFFKTFQGREGTAQLKHIIEPTFAFRYQSPVDDPDRVVNYLRYFRYHQISYGLTNRILVKKGLMPREIFTLGLSQTFYLSPEDSPMNLYRVEGEIPAFSDISGYLRFYPSGGYSLDASAAYNPHYSTFSHLRLRANLGSIEDNAFLKVSWYKSINPYFEEVVWNRHQIGFFGGLKIPRLSLEAVADIDYNIQEKRLLYTGVSVIYHYQCLDIGAELKIFYFREKPETQFRISFGLGNIGKTTDPLGGIGF